MRARRVRARTWLALLGAPALAAVFSCSEATDVLTGPEAPAAGEAAGIGIDLHPERIGSGGSGSSGGAGGGRSDAKALANANVGHSIARTTDATTTLFTFEGIANQDSVRKTVGVAFPDWIALIDFDAGGTGAFANEPSPSTAIFWANKGPTHHHEIVFDQPVSRAELFYAGCINCGRFLRPAIILPFNHFTLTAYDKNGAVVDSATGGENFNGGPGGDPTGNYNKWDPLEVAVADNVITRVRLTGYPNWIGVDNLETVKINYAPVALPGGPYQANEGQPVPFNGSLSYDPVDSSGLKHPFGDPISYSWSFGDGTGTATTAQPSYVYPNSGSYTATLTVVDPNGVPNSATVAVTVANVPPTVNAGPDASVTVGQAYAFSGTFTDPIAADGPWSWTLSWGDGSPALTGSAPSVSTAITASRTFGTPGDYAVVLSVSDKNGGTGVDTVVVKVGNAPPVARITGPTTAAEGSPVTLDGSTSSDPEGQSLTYAWTTSDGGAGSAASLTRAFADNGTFTATLVVTDPYARKDTATHTVTVTNVAPTATFSAPGSVPEGQALALALTAPVDPSSADVAAGFTYAFDCGAGGGLVPAGATATSSCPTTKPEPRIVRGRIADKNGGQTVYTDTVQVQNVAPSVTASVSGGLEAGQPATLEVAFSDPGSQSGPWGWTVAWGDGDTASGQVTTWQAPMGFELGHTYATTGPKTVIVTVTDAAGGVGADTTQVAVFGRPEAELSAPAGGDEGAALTFDASATTDPDDATAALTFTWDFGDGESGTGAVVTHAYADDGTYTVRVIATDPSALADTATAVVEIDNVAPTATFVAPAAAGAGQPFQLTLTAPQDASSADVAAGLQYAFDCGGGAGFGAAGAVPSVTCTATAPGSRTVRGRIRDKDGGATDYSATVLVSESAPIAVIAAPATGLEGAPIAFSGAGSSDPDGGIGALSFAWSFGDGGTATGIGVTHRFPDNGTYTVRLVVTDATQLADTATAQIVISNVAPTGTFVAPATAPEGTPFTLLLQAVAEPSSADSAAGLTFAFDCGDGAGFVPTGPTPGRGCPTTGPTSRSVRGRVTDKDGGASTYTGSVSVVNVAPTLTIGMPTQLFAGQQATLAGSFQDPGAAGAPWSWSIAWDNGQTATGQVGSWATTMTFSAQTAYSQPGTKNVRVIVTDGFGAADTATVAVTVAALQVTIDVKPETIDLFRGDQCDDRDDVLKARDDDSDWKGDRGRNDDDSDSDSDSDSECNSSGPGIPNLGLVSVVIEQRAGFDPRDIDPSSLRLTDGTGPGTPIGRVFGIPIPSSVNAQRGIFHFLLHELINNGDIDTATTVLYISGTLNDGRVFRGSDPVRVIP